MKRYLISLLTILGLFALACGFLDSEAATVTYERGIPVDFEVDADEVCPPDLECGEGETVDAEEDTELQPIEFAVEVDIVDATGNGDLQNIAQRLRSIEITSIDYAVANNDLTFDLPDIDIYVAPLGVEEADHEDSVHLTTLPSVPAEQNDSGRASVEEQNRGAASELFQELQYNAIPNAHPVVKKGQPLPPSGSADIELVVNIKIVANPLDDL